MLAACSTPDEPSEVSGAVFILIETTGKDHDTDGYLAIVDDRDTVALGATDSAWHAGLEPGAHVVRLAGIAANCDSHPLEGSLEFQVTPGLASARVSFVVACYGTGMLIQSSLEGLDPGQYYRVVLNGHQRPEVLPAGQDLEVTALSPGNYEVRLGGLPGNCVVTPERVTVAVTLRNITAVEFTTRCTAAYGMLLVNLVTTGQDLDLGGFSVAVDGAVTFFTAASGQYSHLVGPGPREVGLQDVASNCNVAGATHRDVTMTAGGMTRDTTSITFEVTCRRFWDLAFVRESSLVLATAAGVAVDRGPAGNRPAWSPDGAWLAWECGNICLSHLDTGTTLRIPSSFNISEPAWSPDGSQLVYVASVCEYYYWYEYECRFEGLARYRINGNSDQRIPLPSAVTAATDPAWSPDGATIAFGCTIASNNPQTLCTVKTDGGGYRQLFEPGWQDGEPSWSPDGGRLVFSTSRFGARELATVRADGSDLRRFDPPVQGTSPEWTADGRIFFTDAGGLKAMQADGTGRVVVTASPGDSHPSLRPRP
jgi:hypothetical protein